MTVFLWRGEGACINISAKIAEDEECSAMLYAIEQISREWRVRADIFFDGKRRKRLSHLIASYGLLGSVFCHPSPYSQGLSLALPRATARAALGVGYSPEAYAKSALTNGAAQGDDLAPGTPLVLGGDENGLAVLQSLRACLAHTHRR